MAADRLYDRLVLDPGVGRPPAVGAPSRGLVGLSGGAPTTSALPPLVAVTTVTAGLRRW